MTLVEMARVEAVVIGGGVVGLACAAALARRSASVVLLDPHDGPGRETSSRNSGVIHAGLYYPPGSLKARLCVDGRRRLYRWCAERSVPHRRTGKVLVAVDDEEAERLESIRARAEENGAGEVRMLDADALYRLEPGVRGVSGMWSPESGIVDAHGLMESFVGDARDRGADLVWRTRVEGLVRERDAWRVETLHRSGERYGLRTRFVINAAGLSADRVAELAGLDVEAVGWRLHWCKGSYFALSGGAPRPRNALLYPVPGARGAGLGIHLTVDLGGRCVAGPDADYVDHIDYVLDETKAESFAASVARYLPGVNAEHLSPDYAGVRPKLQPPGGSFRDFVIEEGTAYGAPGTIHLVGIESPGLTASLAIGEHVGRLFEEHA